MITTLTAVKVSLLVTSNRIRPCEETRRRRNYKDEIQVVSVRENKVRRRRGL